jgi:hypothetical protein
VLYCPLSPALSLEVLTMKPTDPDSDWRSEADDRIGFSHPAVEAILLWGFGAKTHWMGPDAALMNEDGALTPAGSRINRLLGEEWTTRGNTMSGEDGRLAFRGFYGDYTLTVATPGGRQFAREAHLTRSAPMTVVQLT